MKELNDYLFQVVQNARKCNHCVLRHDDGVCFFASECIKYDFHYYKEEDDEECINLFPPPSSWD